MRTVDSNFLQISLETQCHLQRCFRQQIAPVLNRCILNFGNSSLRGTIASHQLIRKHTESMRIHVKNMYKIDELWTPFARHLSAVRSFENRRSMIPYEQRTRKRRVMTRIFMNTTSAILNAPLKVLHYSGKIMIWCSIEIAILWR